MKDFKRLFKRKSSIRPPQEMRADFKRQFKERYENKGMTFGRTIAFATIACTLVVFLQIKNSLNTPQVTFDEYMAYVDDGFKTSDVIVNNLEEIGSITYTDEESKKQEI